MSRTPWTTDILVLILARMFLPKLHLRMVPKPNWGMNPQYPQAQVQFFYSNWEYFFLFELGTFFYSNWKYFFIQTGIFFFLFKLGIVFRDIQRTGMMLNPTRTPLPLPLQHQSPCEGKAPTLFPTQNWAAHKNTEMRDRGPRAVVKSGWTQIQTASRTDICWGIHTCFGTKSRGGENEVRSSSTQSSWGHPAVLPENYTGMLK